MVDVVSYAEAAARGAKQTPEEAAAPQPPSVVRNEPVGGPGVQTVEADVPLEIRKRSSRERAQRRKGSSAGAVEKADSWLVDFFAMSDRGATAFVAANVVGVVGIASVLGYKAWGLWEKDQLSWQKVGAGIGVVATVGAVEAVMGHYLSKAKRDP